MTAEKLIEEFDNFIANENLYQEYINKLVEDSPFNSTEELVEHVKLTGNVKNILYYAFVWEYGTTAEEMESNKNKWLAVHHRWLEKYISLLEAESDLIDL